MVEAYVKVGRSSRWRIWLRRGANSHARLTLSITSNINFFKAESKGYLYAEAKEAFSHKRLANCEVRITNEAEELIATFNGTGYRKDTELPFTPLV